MLCDLDWGVEGVERAVARDDVLVIVDTLSFCSAVVTAVEQGAMVYPCCDPEQAASIAEREGATTAVPRKEVSAGQPYSLSPVAYQHIEPGTRIVLASRNGASCLQPASEAEQVYLGCLLNAEAAASHVANVAEEMGKNITLIAVGERSSDHGLLGADRLLFAIEDYLACGAILCGIMADHTAEATVCANAFLQSQEHLRYLLEQSLGGQRLTAQGFGEDVTYSAQLNLCNHVPQFRGKWLIAHDVPQEETISPQVIREPEETPVSEDREAPKETEETMPNNSMDRSEWPPELLALREEALQCVNCDLSETRTHVVFGEGNPHSKLVLIGEGPGDMEDRTGRPFVGRAGQLLDEALERAGIRREDVWICNVLKCRACVIENGRAKNRAPRAPEIKACRPWLEAQLEIIQPSVILCIGAPAANLIIHKGFKMTQERGQWFTDAEFAPNAMAALHPAYILRQHGEPYETALQSLVDDLRTAWERSKEEPPERPQLTLF